MVAIGNFLLTYMDKAMAHGPKRVVSFQLDGKTDEVVYARALYEADGEEFWVTVQRLPSDVSS